MMAQMADTNSLPHLIEQFWFRRRCRHSNYGTTLGSTSAQWVYLGAFHVVSSRSSRRLENDWTRSLYTEITISSQGPMWCDQFISRANCEKDAVPHHAGFFWVVSAQSEFRISRTGNFPIAAGLLVITALCARPW